MSEYYSEIQNVVNSALEELNQGHQSGKVIDSPTSNNLFLLRWVTKSIKSQRFHKVVAPDIIRWQKMGRSKGNDAMLESTFRRIAAYYNEFFGAETKVVTDAMIEAFLEQMEQADWGVTTSEILTDGSKVQFFTDGQNSFALCANQCDDCFDGEKLVKPMSWFVRGNHAEFITKAYEAGFMLHKRTDYKSKVKYHGEYLVYPMNQGPQLVEIPLSFIAK
ncbi:DUF2913 family protein [Vibrio methylphosphonaticus]|uniref:DUF2913 family protein n=1 Tax=Vibrio methylphosphonaticus TaxID=2946866 RepID=UPI00202A4EB2|nr:DUF2913 family protein [Vibrio methylphosphonaticus]MCL9777356.1 DUF2913 family protein [Vibrio methylphosphonaticus]